MKRLIIFLVRRRLGLRTVQLFQFKGQKNKNNYYYFEDDCLMKIEEGLWHVPANVSLNWLLDSKDEIVKLDKSS